MKNKWNTVTSQSLVSQKKITFLAASLHLNIKEITSRGLEAVVRRKGRRRIPIFFSVAAHFLKK